MPTPFHKTQSGFTLIETLVAISIIMVGISATFSVIQFGLSSSIAVKDRIIAASLAQEALEAVRNVKDSNLLAENADAQNNGDGTTPDWLYGVVDDSGSATTGCTSDGQTACDFDRDTPATFIRCGGSSCAALRTDSNGVLSHHTSGTTASRFTRSIVITNISNTNAGEKEARVQVTVAWPGHSIVVTEDINNWFAP